MKMTLIALLFAAFSAQADTNINIRLVTGADCSILIPLEQTSLADCTPTTGEDSPIRQWYTCPSAVKVYCAKVVAPDPAPTQ